MRPHPPGSAVAPQGTGHNAGPLGDLSDTVLLRTSAMTGVQIDSAARTGRVDAGVLWLDVVEAAAAHGLAALHGSSPDVGVVGYSLGGGIGWYARQLGLQANSITAVELVTADGSTVRADPEHEPDLFWALRGGGGNFGVVTALEFALYPITTPYAGMLVWDISDAHRVLSRWAEWAPDAPDKVTTAFRVLNIPPIPEIPEPFRGRSIAVINGAVLGDHEAAAELIAPLRELGPQMDTFGPAPAATLSRLHMDPEGPTPSVTRTSMLGELPSAAVDAAIAVAGPDSGSTRAMAIEFRQLGGALGRSHPGAGALSRLDGAYITFTGGMAMTPEMGAAAAAESDGVIEAMAPWSNGSQYLNFLEEPSDASAGYEAASWTRLQDIRAAADPDGRFHANHRVDPAAIIPAQR